MLKPRRYTPSSEGVFFGAIVNTNAPDVFRSLRKTMNAYKTQKIWAIHAIALACLLALNFTEALISHYPLDYEPFMMLFGFIPELITEGARLGDWPVMGIGMMQSVTYQFLHADLWHFTTNMVLLFVFGKRVERYMGGWRFGLFYLMGGIFAGFGMLLLRDEPSLVIGASGAVSAVMGAYVAHVLFTRGKTRWDVVRGAIGTVFVTYMLAQNIFGLHLALTGQIASNVAFDVHIVGLAAGFVMMCMSVILRARRNRIRITPAPQAATLP